MTAPVPHVRGARRTRPVRIRAFQLAATLAGLPAEALGPAPATVAFSTWQGRRAKLAREARRETTWPAFVALLEEHAARVAAKGTGLALAAPSRDGRRLDGSCGGVHVLTLDVDGAGDWLAFARVLDEAGVSYALARSSSHTPEVPRWHAYLPLASPYAGDKAGWTLRYAHAIGALERFAALRGPFGEGVHGRGADPTVDGRMALSFLGARLTPTHAPPEVLSRSTERALDLDRFLAATGFVEDEARALVAPVTRSSPTRGGRPRAAGGSEAPTGLPILARAFAAAGWLGERRREGWRARCPFASNHTGGAGADDAAVFDSGVWHCPHTHCLSRRQAEVIDALPAEARALVDARQESEGLSRLRGELGAVTTVEPVPLARVERLVATEIARVAAQTSDLAARSDVVLLAPPMGSGKTRGAVLAAAEAPERPALLWVRSTALAVELRARVEATGRAAQRRFGVANARDEAGDPLCKYHETAVALASARLDAPALLCLRCAHSPRNGGACRAFGGAEGRTSERAPAVVAPLGMAGLLADLARQLVDAGRAPTLVVDEPPAGLDTVTVTPGDLAAARKALGQAIEDGTLAPGYARAAGVVLEVAAAGLDALHADVAPDARRAPERALETLGSSTPFVARLDEALVAQGAEPYGVVAVDATGAPMPADATALRARLSSVLAGVGDVALAEDADDEFRRPVGAAKAARVARVAAVMRAAVAWFEGHPATWEPRYRRLTVTTWSRELAVLLAAPAGLVLLDGTPDLALLERACARAGRPLRVTSLAVADAAPVERVVLFTPRANRKALLERTRVRWDVLGPRLARAFTRLAEAEAKLGTRLAWTLLVTLKPIGQALRGKRGGLALDAVEHHGAKEVLTAWLAGGRRVDVAWFGAVEGLDAWKGADACVTVGDPWPALDAATAEGEILALDDEARMARLRERTAALLAQAHGRLRAPSRSAPAVLLHVGAVAPAGWRADQVAVEEIAGGRPRSVATMPAAELAAAVGAAGGVRALARLARVPESSLRAYVAGRCVTPATVGVRIRKRLKGVATR